MQAAAIVLGLAALGGLTLATIRIRGTLIPPTWLAIGHGVIAATGLGLLVYAAFDPGIPFLARIAASVIFLAAIGGVVMFSGFHLRGKALPIPFVIGHGLLAAAGYAMLLVSLFNLA